MIIIINYLKWLTKERKERLASALNNPTRVDMPLLISKLNHMTCLTIVFLFYNVFVHMYLFSTRCILFLNVYSFSYFWFINCYLFIYLLLSFTELFSSSLSSSCCATSPDFLDPHSPFFSIVNRFRQIFQATSYVCTCVCTELL